MDARNRIKLILGIVVFAVVIVALVVFGVKAFFAEGEKRTSNISAGADPEKVPDGLTVDATVQGVDPVKGELTLRLDFTPVGTLAGDESWSTTKDIRIETNGTTKTEVVFKKGQRLSAVDMPISIDDGLYTQYPFDSLSADLQVYVVAVGADGTEEDVPVYLDFWGSVQGYNIQAQESQDSEDTFGEVNITVTRSITTRVVAIFIMALLWLLSLSVLTVTGAIIIQNRKLENAYSSFGWMGAMLFAFVAFRGAAPGIPPIGTLMDFVSFFWAEAIIALCIIVLVWAYLRRLPKDAPAH